MQSSASGLLVQARHLTLRVLDRRTALALSERNKAAAEHRYVEAPVGHHVAAEADKPKKPRIRAEVAKQASVSEKRIRAVAAIRRENPDAYQRIVTGQSSIREEKGAAINKPEREAIRSVLARSNRSDRSAGMDLEAAVVRARWSWLPLQSGAKVLLAR